MSACNMKPGVVVSEKVGEWVSEASRAPIVSLTHPPTHPLTAPA